MKMLHATLISATVAFTMSSVVLAKSSGPLKQEISPAAQKLLCQHFPLNSQCPDGKTDIENAPSTRVNTGIPSGTSTSPAQATPSSAPSTSPTNSNPDSTTPATPGNPDTTSPNNPTNSNPGSTTPTAPGNPDTTPPSGTNQPGTSNPSMPTNPNPGGSSGSPNPQ